MTTTQTANYRVVTVTTNDFGAYNLGHSSKVTETIEWSDTDLNELSRQYPPSDIFGADPLGYSQIEDGLIRTDYRFERRREDDSWEEINDPRRRITPMTSLERQIDAENRRLYPGDYITDDIEGDFDPDDHDQLDSSGDDYPVEQRCIDCEGWFDAKALDDDGLCAECVKDRLDELKPRCADCNFDAVDNAGDVCFFCQMQREEDAKSHCGACGQVHTDSKLEDGYLCKDCNDYWVKHFVWWRRALRRVGLLS